MRSTWAGVSHTTIEAPESPSTHSHSAAEFVGYTGTTTAPADDAARSTSVNSTRVLLSTPTRSPGCRPRSISPWAIACTRDHSSRYVSDAHSPSRWNWAATASP